MSVGNQPREPYRIAVDRRVIKALGALPARDRDRVARQIEGLAAEPRPRNAEKMTDARGRHRLRVGDYRVLDAIGDGTRVVRGGDIGHRRDIYRG